MVTRDLALVGAGYWGKNLARNFLELGALHTLCDANQPTLDNYGSQYASVVFERSFEALLNNEAIRKIAIATPATTHFELAKAALLAGKDVYVEKPLCLDTLEAQDLVDIAKAHGRTLMVGHLLQYHPCVEYLTRLVHSGELGRLYYITSNRLNLGKIRREENALWSFAPHDISVILGLAGRMPETVVCHGSSNITSGVADTTLTQMQFSDGLRAHVFVSWLNPFKEQKLTVVGSNGMAVFDDTKSWDQKLVLYRNYITWSQGNHPLVNKSDGVTIAIPEGEPLQAECGHFLQSCSTREQPRTDGAEGLRVLQVLDAAQRSLDESGIQKVPEANVRAADGDVHPTAILDAGAKVGRGTKVWHFSHVCAGATIGESCSLGQNVFVASGVVIGRNVKIQNNVSVYTGVTLEDDVFLGPSCVLTNVLNPRSQVVRRGAYDKTLIKKGASIGANATIVCGTIIGRYSFVAAGAVVTSDIPDYGFVRGVPAKLVGWMSRHGHVLDFSESSVARCPESNYRYEISYHSASTPVVQCLDVAEEQVLPDEASIGRLNFRGATQARS